MKQKLKDEDINTLEELNLFSNDEKEKLGFERRHILLHFTEKDPVLENFLLEFFTDPTTRFSIEEKLIDEDVMTYNDLILFSDEELKSFGFKIIHCKKFALRKQ
jgi:hypothetical protein